MDPGKVRGRPATERPTAVIDSATVPDDAVQAAYARGFAAGWADRAKYAELAFADGVRLGYELGRQERDE